MRVIEKIYLYYILYVEWKSNNKKIYIIQVVIDRDLC